MKKVFLSLILIGFISVSYSQQTLELLCQKLTEETYKQLHRNALPGKAKIAVCSFVGEYGTENNLTTSLGIMIANEYALQLKRELQGKKRLENIEILINDNIDNSLNAEMLNTFVPPANSADEDKFYKQLQDNQRPDYFISGKYKIIGNFHSIQLKDVRMTKNKFNLKFDDQGFKPPVFESVEQIIESEADVHLLTQFNTNIKNVPEVYADFIKMHNPNKFFDFKIVHASNAKDVAAHEALRLNAEYQLQVNVMEDLYLYGFSYESEDLQSMHMYMLYPISPTENNFCKAGIYSLPKMGNEEFTFYPSPPISGQYLIKIIASKTKLALDFTQTEQGYIYLSESQCQAFYKQLKNMAKTQYQTATLVKDIRE